MSLFGSIINQSAIFSMACVHWMVVGRRKNSRIRGARTPRQIPIYSPPQQTPTTCHFNGNRFERSYTGSRDERHRTRENILSSGDAGGLRQVRDKPGGIEGRTARPCGASSNAKIFFGKETLF